MARTATYSITNTNATHSLPAVKFRPCELVRIDGSHAPMADLINPSTGNPYLAAAGQYYTNGDMVYLNAGAVTERLTADTGPIAGFVTSGGSGSVSGDTPGTTVITTSRQIGIMPVNSRDVYAMNLYNGTAANCQQNDIATFIGNIYGLAQATITEEDGSTTYCTVVDSTNTTQVRVVVVGLQKPLEESATTPYCRVLVKFLPVITGATAYQGLQFDA